MLENTINSTPTIESDGVELPLISSYTIKDETSYSVFILSRKLDGNHDGIDFGNGYTPVTLHLPFSEVTEITRYRLEKTDGSPANPRTNNISDLQVVIGSASIDPVNFSSEFVIAEKTGRESGGGAPGSINLFVFNLAGTQNPSLAESLELLRLCAGIQNIAVPPSLSDINGDRQLGLAEVIEILRRVKTQ